MKFSTVAQMFDRIEKTTSRIEMTKLLAHIFHEATGQELQALCYLALGTLRAPYENVQFNFAQKSFEKVLATVLDIPVEEVRAQVHRLGDLGSVIYHVGTTERKQGTDIGLLDLYEKLIFFAQTTGTDSQEEKQQQMLALLQQVDPLSGQYIVRIVLGTLRLGFSDMTLIDALSWMLVGDKSARKTIEDAYNICADIGLIGATLKKGGLSALEEMHIHVGIPIRLAAAERLPSASAIFEKIGPCIAQPKLDGFRLQIHIDKRTSCVKFFSRNLLNMSAMFPDVLDALHQLPVQTAIIEGEAIVVDPDTEQFVPFQETVKRKRKYDIEQIAKELPLQIFLFDILYVDGKELLQVGYEERRATLAALISKKDTYQTVQLIPEERVTSADQLEAYFLKSIQAGLEGVVVKKPHSFYQPGKRNFNWIKLKRAQEGNLEDTIDCVVLGYYKGSGKRAHFGIGAFLVGIYTADTDTYQTIAKIGTGLTDEEWKILRKKCDEHAVSHKPVTVECAKELYPDVWTNPEIVCVIRADEITISPLHTAAKTPATMGYALRFPRFMGYRPDKSPEQTTSAPEIKRLYEDQFAHTT